MLRTVSVFALATTTWCALCSAGCASSTPVSLGEQGSGYTYVPVDPFTIKTGEGAACPIPKKPEDILPFLPDNAVRMSVEEFTASGSVKYGPASVAAEGSSYRITVDYTNSDTRSMEVWIAKFAQAYNSDPKAVRTYIPVKEGPFSTLDRATYTDNTERYEVLRHEPTADKDAYRKFSIPVYVGIGLRVVAYVTSQSGSTDISGLGVIGAEAEAKNLSGSLVVQTLGVNSKSVSAALPIQSELNRTTAQNAIVAIGSVKALLYQDSSIVPRVVGLYLPFPGGKPLVNAIISSLSADPIGWTCGGT